MLITEHKKHIRLSKIIRTLGKKRTFLLTSMFLQHPSAPLANFWNTCDTEIPKSIFPWEVLQKMEAEKTVRFLPSVGSIFDSRMCFLCSVRSTCSCVLQHLSCEKVVFGTKCVESGAKTLLMLGKTKICLSNVLLTEHGKHFFAIWRCNFGKTSHFSREVLQK